MFPGAHAIAVFRNPLRITVVLLSLSLASCKSAGRVSAEAWTPSDSLRVGSVMRYLASDDLMGRDTGSPGLDSAAAYLEENLRQMRIPPFFSSYRDTLSNSKEIAYNVVAYLPGKDRELKEEIVLIGAHYDHIGLLPLQDGDRIANGANDNASGTATVLELARFLAGSPRTNRSVLIAFFSAEERGLLGSRHLANRLQQQGVNLYAVLNFEMTGVPMSGKDHQLYLTGFDRSNLAEVSNRYAGENLVGFLPQAREYNLFKRSDNYAFYEVFGVPSHTYSTFDFTNYDHYHQAGDEADQMDFAHMARLVNALTRVVYGVANGPAGELKPN